ncbi:hypothetical protein GOP47_0011441 [Adiantum capillus-veneris]|uniref:Uncharacterized protein n=1 Tax=Adiantum capillus-veneris TaxID=13818 RepID=A0A9D4UU87_ADICA|nr:hypothetical protein GOP47_0011441 [Adiantum capillus-veneris]
MSSFAGSIPMGYNNHMLTLQGKFYTIGILTRFFIPRASKRKVRTFSSSRTLYGFLCFKISSSRTLDTEEAPIFSPSWFWTAISI